MISSIDMLINFGIPLVLVLVAYFVGNSKEKKHLLDIQAREKTLQGFPVITFDTLPGSWKVGSSDLVNGSVVISLDYFKRIIAGLRGIVGGRIKTYEPLLERARREAMLRMIEDAKARGFNAVINVRLETSKLANSGKRREGVAGVEMLAFGTAITLT